MHITYHCCPGIPGTALKVQDAHLDPLHNREERWEGERASSYKSNNTVEPAGVRHLLHAKPPPSTLPACLQLQTDASMRLAWPDSQRILRHLRRFFWPTE